MRRGRTDAVSSLGSVLEERKPLLVEGIVEEDANNRL
jgi:hypothetical protein